MNEKHPENDFNSPKYIPSCLDCCRLDYCAIVETLVDTSCCEEFVLKNRSFSASTHLFASADVV